MLIAERKEGNSKVQLVKVYRELKVWSLLVVRRNCDGSHDA